jgi:signal transduction histidine kinase
MPRYSSVSIDVLPSAAEHWISVHRARRPDRHSLAVEWIPTVAGQDDGDSMKQERGRDPRARPGQGSALRRRELVKARPRPDLEAEVARLTARVHELEHERETVERERVAAGDFVAMAAHEVLKPLVMTEAAATLISERARDALDLESRQDLDLMIRVSARVRRVVEALLMDASDAQRPLSRRPVDLGDVLVDCIDLLGAEIEERGVHVDVDPLPVVSGNADLLGGVFSNLLANALKYGAREGGDIRVSATRSAAGWTFHVTSPGPVIEERERRRIFEPWQRGIAERRATSFGLGLAVVRRIVERHGGHVGVRPATGGGGNRFYFTLPA